MSATYTLLDTTGRAIAHGLSASDAAAEILTSDGREYDIRADDTGGYVLWTRHQVAGLPWTPTIFYSAAENIEEAEADIYAAVVVAERFCGHPEAVTDDQYIEMLTDYMADLDPDTDADLLVSLSADINKVFAAMGRPNE